MLAGIDGGGGGGSWAESRGRGWGRGQEIVGKGGSTVNRAMGRAVQAMEGGRITASAFVAPKDWPNASAAALGSDKNFWLARKVRLVGGSGMVYYSGRGSEREGNIPTGARR